MSDKKNKLGGVADEGHNKVAVGQCEKKTT